MTDDIQFVTSIAEPHGVNELPRGAVVGDRFGGRSFSDSVAAALERRSDSGWQDVVHREQQWTLIVVTR